MRATANQIRVLGLVIAISLATVGWNCNKTPRSRSNSTPQTESTLFRWGNQFPRYIDPNRVSGMPGTYLALNIFEGLLVPAPGSGPPLPGVALRYTLSADGRSYTFHLRRDARWSNGRSVTARDFEYAWKRALTPEFISENAELLWQFIDGAAAFKRGLNRDWKRVGITVVNRSTLRVRLLRPTPFFPHLVAGVAYLPVPREAVERHKARWTQPENIVVNGPYKPVLFRDRERIRLIANPQHREASRLRIKRWEFVHLERSDTALRLFRLGQLHYVSGLVPANQIPLLKSQPRSGLRIDPMLCSYYLKFNLTRPPFDDLNVRRAFNLALNKEALVTNLLRGGQLPATNLLPRLFEKTQRYKSPAGPQFDAARARKLLAASRYAGKMPSVTLIYNAGDLHRRVAGFVRASLKKHLGLSIQLHPMEWKSLLARVRQGRQFQLARGSWCADYPDPTSFLQIFHSQSSKNDAGWRNSQFDRLLASIHAVRQRSQRNRLIEQAERLLISQLPYLPLFHYTKVYLLDPRIAGFKPHLMDHHLVKYMHFRRR